MTRNDMRSLHVITSKAYHRLVGVRQDAKRRIVRIKINEDKLRTFAALPLVLPQFGRDVRI